MNTKTTLLLLVATCGLLGFIKVYSRKHPSTREMAERGEYLLSFDRGNIDGIVLTSNEDRIELHKNGERWELVSPVKDRADQAAVDEILTRCEQLKREERLTAKRGDNERLNAFGVGMTNVRLKLLGRDEQPQVLFGKEAAVDGKTYVRLENSSDICVTNNDLRNLIVRKADEFRDHRLTDLIPAQVTKLVFTTSAGEIAVGKTGDHWELNKPMKARAEDAKINDLVSALLTMQIVAFVPEKGANLNAYGLSEPRGCVTIWTVGDEKPSVLQIGAHDDKTGETYGRISSRDAVYLLPKQIERLLTLQPNDLRDRHLLRVDLDIVDRLTVEAVGNPKVTIQRRQEEWVQIEKGGQRLVNSKKVQEFVKALQTGQISAFVADVGSDLGKYGLDHPRLKVTFSSYSSENTAETNAGDRPLLTVAFGNTDGENVYACVEDEPFVVSVKKTLVDALTVAPAEWHALSIFQFDPADVASLDIRYPAVSGSGNSTVPTPPPVSLIRHGNDWQLAASAGTLNSINAQSLLNTLTHLSAIRWVGGATGVGKSTEIISFSTNSGKKATLLLGSATAGQPCDASLEGESATFLISSPDESALRLPLITP